MDYIQTHWPAIIIAIFILMLMWMIYTMVREKTKTSYNNEYLNDRVLPEVDIIANSTEEILNSIRYDDIPSYKSTLNNLQNTLDNSTYLEVVNEALQRMTEEELMKHELYLGND